MLSTKGFNHIAITTADMKECLEFYCNVLGIPLVGIFPMHSAEDSCHSFLEAEPGRLLSFVQFGPKKEGVPGMTYLADPTDSVAPGAMHHLALHVDEEEELDAYRERIKKSGRRVTHVIDHGFCKSIYFYGPDMVWLEISTFIRDLNEDEMDVPTAERYGISAEELEAMKHPALVS